MSFEPTKVIEMNKGKQIGNTLMQDASSIPYNNTNVKDELDTINSDLSDCLKAKTFRVQINTPNINTNYSVDYSAQIPSGARGVILLDCGICNQDHSIELQGVNEKIDVYHYSSSSTIVFNRRDNVDSRYPYCYASFMVVY